MTDKEKKTAAILLLLWWLWPRPQGSTQTSCTYFDTDSQTYKPCPEDIQFDSTPTVPANPTPLTWWDTPNSGSPWWRSASDFQPSGVTEGFSDWPEDWDRSREY